MGPGVKLNITITTPFETYGNSRLVVKMSIAVFCTVILCSLERITNVSKEPNTSA
jgi:hypothetical protein